jgi:hypothetical protein
MEGPMPLLLRNKDFWSGAMLVAIGVAAVAIARGYPMGTSLRMGPAYFPTMLGGLLVLGGVYLVFKGFRSTDFIEPGWSLRALIVVPLTLVVFGVLMDRAGFIPALVVLILGSAAAGREFRLVEMLLFTAGLTIMCIAVFIWGLGLPYPLLADF